MEIIIGFIILAIILVAVGKLIALPFKLVIKLASSLVIGAVAIWVVNLFGAGIEITFLNALIASVVVSVITMFI